jgi:hypothetical protein
MTAKALSRTVVFILSILTRNKLAGQCAIHTLLHELIRDYDYLRTALSLALPTATEAHWGNGI